MADKDKLQVDRVKFLERDSKQHRDVLRVLVFLLDEIETVEANSPVTGDQLVRISDRLPFVWDEDANVVSAMMMVKRFHDSHGEFATNKHGIVNDFPCFLECANHALEFASSGNEMPAIVVGEGEKFAIHYFIGLYYTMEDTGDFSFSKDEVMSVGEDLPVVQPSNWVVVTEMVEELMRMYGKDTSDVLVKAFKEAGYDFQEVIHKLRTIF